MAVVNILARHPAIWDMTAKAIVGLCARTFWMTWRSLEKRDRECGELEEGEGIFWEGVESERCQESGDA